LVRATIGATVQLKPCETEMLPVGSVAVTVTL